MTQIRVVVYECKDGSEIVSEVSSIEEEQHERAQAEREVHQNPDRTSVVGYRFEWRDENKK